MLVRSEQNEREEIFPEAPAGGEDKVKGKMKPEQTTFESPLAGTVVEAPEQPHLSRRDMQPTTVGGYRHADGRGSEQEDSTSS